MRAAGARAVGARRRDAAGGAAIVASRAMEARAVVMARRGVMSLSLTLTPLTLRDRIGGAALAAAAAADPALGRSDGPSVERRERDLKKIAVQS